MLGLDKFNASGSAGQIGWLQNVTGDNSLGTFNPNPPGCFQKTTLINGVNYPLVDSGRNNVTNGSTLYLSNSSVAPLYPDPLGIGYDFSVTCFDSPAEACSNKYPNTSPPEYAISFTGGRLLCANLSYYSTDFPSSYSVIATVNWTAYFSFTYNSTNFLWSNVGSLVSAGTSILSEPQSTSSLNISTSPLTYQYYLNNGSIQDTYYCN